MNTTLPMFVPSLESSKSEAEDEEDFGSVNYLLAKSMSEVTPENGESMYEYVRVQGQEEEGVTADNDNDKRGA